VREGAVQLRLRGAPHLVLQAGSIWEAPVPAMVDVEARPVREELAPAPDRAPQHERRKRAKAVRRAAVDSKTEDAMYLRILDLLRADREPVARRLAQRYLQEFPDGFRRAEITRIAYPTASDVKSARSDH
jgi:hypothetical protein